MIGLLVVAVLTPAVPARGHGSLDQTHVGDTGAAVCSTAAYPGSHLVSVTESRQSFVPSRGGLASLDLCLEDLLNISGAELTVRIYEGGTATTPGEEIASVQVDVAEDILEAEWVHVDFPGAALPDGAPTTPGATYVIGLDPTTTLTTSVAFRWRATCSAGLVTSCDGTPDAYPSGSTNDLPPNADYGFRTFPLHPSDLVGAVTIDDVVCPGLDLTDRAAGRVTNTGATSVGPFATQWYVSGDPALSEDDLAVDGGRHEVAFLGAGESAAVPPPVSFPTSGEVGPGTSYLLLAVDVDQAVVESGETNNLAAGQTTVTACGQPQLTDLRLAVAEDHVATGFRRVQVADLPLHDLAAGLPQTAEEAAQNYEAAPFGFSPFGFSPFGFSPFGFSPFGFSPFGFSPFGFSPFGFSPIGDASLSAVLDDLPDGVADRILVVDVPVADPLPGWDALLAGLIGDRPIQDVTLAEAARLRPDLRVADVDLRSVLRASWLSLALANGTLNDTPLADGQEWCAWLATRGFDCEAAGVDPATDSLLALEAAGAPVRAAPLGGQPLGTTTLNPDWLVNAEPLTGDARARLELTRLGALSPNEALDDPGAIVDCARFDCDRPLSEAVVAEAIHAVDVGTLLSRLSPTGLQTATVTDLALLIADLSSVDLGDMLWTLTDPHRIDPTCPRMNYGLSGQNTGTAAAVRPTATVTLAPGFGYVQDSAELVVDGAGVGQPGPLITRGEDGARTLTFELEAVVGSSFELSFEACANLYTGHHTAGEAHVEGIGIDGPFVATTEPGSGDTVEVVEQSEERGPADSPDLSQAVAADQFVALHIQSADDTDHLQVAVPDAPNSLTVVRVFPPPMVDVDVTVHGPAQSPFGFSPIDATPDELGPGFAPFGFSPFGFSPFGFSPFGFSDAGGLVNSTDDSTEPDVLGDIPTQLAPTDTSGLRAISANRGDQPETVYLRNYDGDEGVFTVGISGYNGVRSDAPVIVTVQQIAARPDPALAECDPAPWTLTAPAGSSPTWEGTEPPRTLFVTNRQVTAELFGEDAAAHGVAALQELALRPEIGGMVLEVDHDPDVQRAYAAWRDDWCSPTAANVAASEVRAEILRLRARYPSIDTVVLAGGDEVVPDFRLIDRSQLGNEAQYTETLLQALGGNNPLVAAYAHGTIPTADPYGTESPTVFGESFAYIPSAGVSRLVETPADWIAQKDQYLLSDGVLDPDDGFVSGYDGMIDGAAAAAAALEAAGVPTTELTRTTPPWNAADFRTGITHGPGIAGYNAHANHWALLSAAGSAFADVARTEIVTAAEQAHLPFGGLVFSNGCHLGTQAPDALNTAATADQAERLTDWAQSIARRGGIAVANSGFGIFETETVGYGEQLQTLFADGLASAPNAAIALARAKARYLAATGVYDPYQYKVVQQLSMYGLGIFRTFSGTGSEPAPEPAPAAESIDVSTGSLTFATATTERGSIVEVVDHPTAIDTSPLAVNARPIVPKLTLATPLPPGRASAGVWLTGLEATQLHDVDPVIARMGLSRADRASEAQMRSTIFPTSPAVAVDLNGTAYVTFPVGSFVSDATAGGEARGTLRLNNEIRAELLLRDASTNPVAPHIPEVTTVRSRDASLVVIDAVADETGGPNQRAAALALDDGGNWTYQELHQASNGHWTGAIRLTDGATELTDLLVQVSNGNAVGYWRNKGEPPRLEVDVVDRVDVLLSSTVGQHGSGMFLGPVDATIAGRSGVTYTVYDREHVLGDHLDGAAFTITEDGAHELRVLGSDGSVALRTFAIDGTAPEIELRTPPVGAVYTAFTQVALDVACRDVGTGSTCDVTVDGVPTRDGAELPTSRVGDHTVTVTAVDGVGHVSTLSRTYTVDSFYTSSGFFSPIEPKPQLNVAKTGSKIAVKFDVMDADGNEVGDPAVIDTREWAPIDCATKASSGGAPSTATGTVPEYSGFFHFNVIAHTTPGCYELVVTLRDGTPLGAYFELK